MGNITHARLQSLLSRFAFVVYTGIIYVWDLLVDIGFGVTLQVS